MLMHLKVQEHSLNSSISGGILSTSNFHPKDCKRVMTVLIPCFSSSDNDKDLSYLQKFVEWLTSWEELPNESEVKFRNQTGKLSKETHFSLRHTTETWHMFFLESSKLIIWSQDLEFIAKCAAQIIMCQ